MRQVSMEECYDGLPFAAGSSSTRSSYASCFTFALLSPPVLPFFLPAWSQPSFTIVQFIAAEHVHSIHTMAGFCTTIAGFAAKRYRS
ncbi:hypothetical protein V8C44DRAFT_321925 [Trichoderma aethiopicum]